MKELQTAHTIANTIRLSRTVARHKTALLIEGTKDRRLYSNWIDRERCQPYPVQGRERALEVLTILKREGMPGVLAVIDADTDHLEHSIIPNPDVISTTTRDLEGILIQSAALEKVLNEHNVEPNRFNVPIRTLLLRAASPLGYLRWISKRNGWSLVFKNLRLNSFINSATMQCDLEKMCTEVIANTRGFALSATELVHEIKRIADHSHNLWHVAQGHDLAGMIAIIVSNPVKVHTGDEIESDLRLAFSSVDFKTSNLFAAICSWQAANVPFTVLNLECP